MIMAPITMPKTEDTNRDRMSSWSMIVPGAINHCYWLASRSKIRDGLPSIEVIHLLSQINRWRRVELPSQKTLYEL